MRDSQLCLALRAIPDDRQLPQQEVQMVENEEKNEKQKLWIKSVNILTYRYGWEAFEYYYYYTEEERRSPEMGLK